MSRHKHRTALRATTSLLTLSLFASQAIAQDTADAGFLGTLLLGESKRDVQTDTAVAETVVDAGEIADRQAGTIAELVDSVPGVTLVNGATASGSGINIRGFGANGTYGTDQKVLIQIDGATRGSEELYRIGNQLFTDPFLYREVSVIRGTVGSFEYGSGVVGGVVRLETKNGSDVTNGELGFALRQTIEATSNGDGLTSSTILAWQPSEDTEFLANYTRRTQGVMTDGDGNQINPAGGDVDDPSWLLKAKHTFGSNRDMSLTFSLSETSSDQRDVPYDSFGNVNFGNVDRLTQTRTGTLSYNYNPVGNDLIDLTVALTYADEVIDNTAIIPSFPLLDADHQYETTTLSFKNTALFDTGVINHNLRAGVEFIRRERLDASSAPGGIDNRVAVFLVNDMKIGDFWTVTPAVRYEMSDIEGSTAPNNGTYQNDALMGGISVRREWASGFAAFASAAYTESLPIIDDLSNPAFMTQSEKARSFEIGASYASQDVFGEGDALALKINAYQTHLWDVTSYFGVDRVENTGLEFEASYSTEPGYYLDFNANIASGDETALLTGVVTDWDNTPANSLGLTIGKKFGEELDLSWEMVANKEITLNTSGGVVNAPGFVVHNLRATYAPQQGVLEGTEIRLGIENVLDTQFTPHLSTRPSAGRNFKLTLAKTF